MHALRLVCPNHSIPEGEKVEGPGMPFSKSRLGFGVFLSFLFFSPRKTHKSPRDLARKKHWWFSISKVSSFCVWRASLLFLCVADGTNTGRIPGHPLGSDRGSGTTFFPPVDLDHHTCRLSDGRSGGNLRSITNLHFLSRWLLLSLSCLCLLLSS